MNGARALKPLITLPSAKSLLLRVQFSGQPLSTATGFIALGNSGIPMLITNRHNVTGRDQLTHELLSTQAAIPDEVVVVHHARDSLGTWVERTEPLYKEDGTPRWREHPALGPKADFVALPLSDWEAGIDLYPYDPANPGPPMVIQPADIVSVIGFPFGRSSEGLPVWATGFIASEPVIDFDEMPIQLIDCRSRQGQSGSPVISYRGNGQYATSEGMRFADGPVWLFLGIYSGRINRESDIGMVWKAQAIAELLSVS